MDILKIYSREMLAIYDIHLAAQDADDVDTGVQVEEGGEVGGMRQLRQQVVGDAQGPSRATVILQPRVGLTRELSICSPGY
jgi:hypothetical protein